MTDQLSHFDRIGGGPAVRAAVDEFYGLVLADERLRPYFAMDMDRLKRHQAALLSSVLGGPATYEGRELGEAHSRLGITGPHYKLVCDYLVSVLWRLHVDEDIIGAVQSTLATLQDTIVTIAPAATGPDPSAGSGPGPHPSPGMDTAAAFGYGPAGLA